MSTQHFRKTLLAVIGGMLIGASLSGPVAADEPAAAPVPPLPLGNVPPPPAPPNAPFGGAIFHQFVPAGAIQVIGPAQMETGKFWFGMMCMPAQEPVRTQLGLAEGTGLVVHEVVPDGPAAKAGVKRHDILLQAGGKPLPDAAALSKIANDNDKPGAVEFKLLRGGKEQTTSITPGERPAPQFNVVIPQAGDPQAVEQWIQHLRQLAADRQGAAVAGRPLRLRILQPGRVAGAIAVAGHPFPADLSVKVTRDGNNPVKIEVRQGDKNWQITGDEISKLPETIRPHIEGMLGNMTAGRAVVHSGTVEAFEAPQVEFGAAAVEEVSVTPPAPANAPAKAAPPKLPLPKEATPKDRGAEIDQLRNQLQEMQRRLDNLGEQK